MLYEILKAAKLGTAAAPDMFTGLLAQKMKFAKGGGEIAKLSGVPPLRFKSDGEPLLDWHITGSGTTSNPVEGVGVGVRTENLLAPDSKSTNQSGQERNGGYFTAGIYYILNNTSAAIFWRNGISDTSSHPIAAGSGEVVTTTDTLVVWHSGQNTSVMVAASSTAIPFEPYGYKIPVTCGGETTNIYIGDSPLYDGDTISITDTGIVIPTVRGNNVLTVDTTVQPSEVYIKYKK